MVEGATEDFSSDATTASVEDEHFVRDFGVSLLHSQGHLNDIWGQLWLRIEEFSLQFT